MECADLVKILGERIKTVRKSRKVSQETLAELANLHPIYVSKIESGKVRGSICTYSALAAALGMTLAELVQVPGDLDSLDSNLLALFQSAKRLEQDKQSLFIETVKGVLNGLGVK